MSNARLALIQSLKLLLATLGLLSILTVGDIYLYNHTFLSVALFLAFVTRPLQFRRFGMVGKIIDFLCLAVIVVEFFRVTVWFDEFQARLIIPSRTDIVFGVLMVLLVLEATRRLIGWVLPAFAVLFMLHALYGHYFPGFLNSSPSDLKTLIKYIYMDTSGIYGIPLLVMATYVIVFLLFAETLNSTGVGKYFTDSAIRLTGNMVGGPAKAAVLSSAFMGSVSGSAVANVVGTGTFTIPLMKRIGFSPLFAGSVEAVASTGGQIMPPIMGAAAFLIAQYLGVPYRDIVIAAFIPAVMYYLGVYFQIDLRARKEKLPVMGKAGTRPLLREIYLLIPLAVLVAIIFAGMSATLAAFIALLSAIVVGMFHKKGEYTSRNIVHSLVQGAGSVLAVALAGSCAGILIGSLFISGLGIKLTDILVDMAGGNLPVLLIFAAILALILGMGMTTSAVYLTLVVLVIPALIKAGVTPLAAHLFAFYFGCICAITPPVALAAYAAASISGANVSKTGWQAFRLGFAAYLIPFMFVYREGLLFRGSALDVLSDAFFCLIGIFMFSVFMEGWLFKNLSWAWRLYALGTGILLIYPSIWADLAGLLLAAFFIGLRYGFWKSKAGKAEAAG